MASRPAGPARAKARAAVPLDTKMAPSQDRARVTFEAILEVTGELLGEVGVERLSTNMICERAGITPPALYRYFPNKYAILKEMGRRLSAEEDEAVFAWLAGRRIADGSLEEEVAGNIALLERVQAIIRSHPGGVWIQRVMRAIPVLREVRAESLDLVSGKVAEAVTDIVPQVDAERLRIATLLSTALMLAANEMAVDEPEIAGPVTAEVSRMMALYYRDLLGRDRN